MLSMTHPHGAPLPPADSGFDARGVSIARFFVAAAMLYAAAGMSAALFLSPRVPFADAWRHYTRLLTAPFPGSVLAADNGHPEIFANLVRWVSLWWLRGSESVQIAIGLLLLAAAFAVFVQIIRRAADIAAPVRAAAVFSLALGLFWLGNARALLHDNETLHVYSVFLCLAGAIFIALRRPAQTLSIARVCAATALCFVASLNFGSGIASFVALLSLLFLMHAPPRGFAVVAAGLLLAVVCYVRLAGGVGSAVSFQPVDQAMIALRWLSVPLIYLFWPFVDPNAAAAMPYPLNALAGLIARAWTQLFGNVHASAMPQAIAGFAFVALLCWRTWRARRRPEDGNDIEKLGLALSWFGAAVAGLVALTRTGYFAEFPLQLSAPRYLPWSSLAWAGLLMAFVARQPPRRWTFATAAAVGVFALAAEGGMVMVMMSQRTDADDTALAAVVGLWPTGPGENHAIEVRASADAMRKRAVGPFAWPEARWIGKAVPPAAKRLAIRTLQRNEEAPSGVRLEAVVADRTCANERLLVADQQRVVGLLRHLDGDRWRGAANHIGRNDSLDIFALDCAN
jgi:hypothetical protein